MNQVDKNRPVSSIKHDDKRVAIPDSAHQGEEEMAISGIPENIDYGCKRSNKIIRPFTCFVYKLWTI